MMRAQLVMNLIISGCPKGEGRGHVGHTKLLFSTSRHQGRMQLASPKQWFNSPFHVNTTDFSQGEYGIAWAQEGEGKHALQRNISVASHTSCSRNLHL